jgi:hypothetical protein
VELGGLGLPIGGAPTNLQLIMANGILNDPRIPCYRESREVAPFMQKATKYCRDYLSKEKIHTKAGYFTGPFDVKNQSESEIFPLPQFGHLFLGAVCEKSQDRGSEYLDKRFEWTAKKLVKKGIEPLPLETFEKLVSGELKFNPGGIPFELSISRVKPSFDSSDFPLCIL